MALIDNCTLWNKLESANYASDIGAHAVDVGVVTYGASKFNNGARSTANTNYVTFAQNIPQTAGCMGFYWKANFNPGGAQHYDMFSCGIAADNYKMRMYHNWAAGFTFHLYWNGGNLGGLNISDANAGFTASGDILYFLIAWDSGGGLAGGKSIEIYVDGVLKATDASNWAAGDMVNVRIGNGANIGGVNWWSNAYQDNVKFYNVSDAATIAAIIANKDNEGFPAAAGTLKKGRMYAIPAFTAPAPTPVLFAPTRAKVLLIGDVDIYAEGLVDKIGNTTESRSFRRDKMIDNEIQIQVDNEGLDFSPENSKSFLNGTSWYFSQVKMWDEDDIKIWDGKLWKIIRESRGRTTKLISRSVMSKIKNIKVVYESAANETGADALMNIFAALDTPFTEYNQKTFQDSAAVLTAAGALLKLKITAEDNLSMQNVIAKVAEYCAADSYGHLGEIYFKVWTKITGTGSVSIDGSNVLKQPVTQDVPEEIINTYSIGYAEDDGSPATDEDNNNVGATSRARYGTRSLPELSTGDENQIVFANITTAVWIGEQYIKRTHRNIDTIPLPLIMSSYSVEGRLRNHITLETILGFTYPDEGFAEEPMEVFRFVRNNDQKIVDLITYTVAS